METQLIKKDLACQNIKNAFIGKYNSVVMVILEFTERRCIVNTCMNTW